MVEGLGLAWSRGVMLERLAGFSVATQTLAGMIIMDTPWADQVQVNLSAEGFRESGTGK